MKYSCDVIRDLLPLYLDDVASAASRQIVEEHLAECAECRGLLSEMKHVEVEMAVTDEREQVIAGQRRFFQRRSALVGSVVAGIFMIPTFVCLVVNLATGTGLDWFFIVFASLLVAASLSIVPLMAPEDKGLWTFGSFCVCLLLLLGVCCLYSGGRWFFVASSSVLFGLSLIFLPFVVKSRALSDFLGDHKGLAVMTADTVLFIVMMLTIGMHTRTPGFFKVAAAISGPFLLLAWGLFFLIRSARRSAVNWLVIAACLVVMGSVGFCLTMAVHHWDFSLLSSKKMETNTYEVHESFQEISILSDTEDIEFLLSEDGKCSVVCYESEKEKHTVFVQDGTLAIQRMDSRRWYDYLSLFSFGASTILVYLPQTEYDSLSIEESTGDILLPKELTFGGMDLSLSTGHVDCFASSSGLLRVKTDTGDIHLEGLSAGALDLTVSTGRVRVQSVVCEGDAGITVSTGKTDLTDVSCRNLNSTGDTGDLSLKDVIVEEMLSLRRSTGDVSLERSDAGELMIETDTGRVTGSLLSEKKFIAQSDTGRIHVPETLSGGICRITTDTGDIRIELIDE